MITGIDINETIEYTCEGDTDPKTVFILGVIPTVVMAAVKDKSRTVVMNIFDGEDTPRLKTNLGEMQLEYVRYGLKGWRQMVDKDGKDIVFQNETVQHGGKDVKVASDESLNVIPDDVMTELSGVVQKMNSLNAKEIKNSKSPSV